MRLFLFLIALALPAKAQVSMVSTCASLPTAHVAGRVILCSDIPLIVRDNGATYSYYATALPVGSITPPQSLTGATTTLNGDINNSTTTVIVNADVCTVPCVIQIGSEYMRVTSKSTVTYTVSRAYESSNLGSGGAAASHTSGDTVTLLNWVKINVGASTAYDNTSGPLTIMDVTPTGCAWNHVPFGQANIISLVKPVTGTYSVKAIVGSQTASRASGWEGKVGITFRESSSGKQTDCQADADLNNWFASATYGTSANAATSDYVTAYYRKMGTGSLWMLRGGDDGANRTCDITIDGGAHWLNFYTQGRTVNMTADEVGFMVNSCQGTVTGTAPISSGFLLSWAGVN